MLDLKKVFIGCVLAASLSACTGENKVLSENESPRDGTQTPGPTATVGPSPIPVVTSTPAPVVIPAPAPVVTPTPVPVVTPTPSPVVTPTPTPVVTPTPTPISTPTPEPSEYAEELAAVLALGDLTAAPNVRDENGSLTTIQAGDFKTIYYDVLNYQGTTTRAFAWVGVPDGASASNPVPAVVLVHGGGGTAFSQWVSAWTARGYAAISIAVEGQTDVRGGSRWEAHAWAGPSRAGVYGDTNRAISEQWMYHAVADTILANSLMRSMPFVDQNYVGLIGASWGGVIAATAMGIDTRFDFVIPVYGAGAMAPADNYFGNAVSRNVLYNEVWDPMIRIKRATMPSLWVSWPEDNHFPIDRQAITYRSTSGETNVTLIPGMGHGGTTWNVEETYDFADSVVITGRSWIEQTYVSEIDFDVQVDFATGSDLDRAVLVSTRDNGYTGDRTWTQSSATLTFMGDDKWQVNATLPSGVTGWFVNVYSGDLVVSSGYQSNDAGTDISPYVKVNTGEWENINVVQVTVGDQIQFAPEPISGGAWVWTGPNGFTASERAPIITNMQSQNAGVYHATYTDVSGNVSRKTFTIELN